MFDMKVLFLDRSHRRVVASALAAFIALPLLTIGDANAGCGDVACGRVDWTEVTDMDQGAPAAAKLHGAYAWEASPDFWGTHPLAGTVSGYFWLTCLSPSGTNAVCKGQLAAEMAKAGTDMTLTVNGNYFDADAGTAVRPAGLFVEGEGASPTPLGGLVLGGMPANPEVCPAALGLPRNAGDAAAPDATGGAEGGPFSDASTGGSSGSGPAPSDEGGCSTAGRGSSAHAGFAAFLLVAALLGAARHRSCD